MPFCADALDHDALCPGVDATLPRAHGPVRGRDELWLSLSVTPKAHLCRALSPQCLVMPRQPVDFYRNSYPEVSLLCLFTCLLVYWLFPTTLLLPDVGRGEQGLFNPTVLFCAVS